MGGAKPISNRMKVLKGTDQPTRMRDEVDFGQIVKIPPPPKYFNRYSKKLYKTTCAKLNHMKLLSDINLPIVVGYASMMGKYWEAEELLVEEGRICESVNIKTGATKVYRNPLDRMATEYLESAKKFAVELGITPASSSKVKAPEKPKRSKLEGYN